MILFPFFHNIFISVFTVGQKLFQIVFYITHCDKLAQVTLNFGLLCSGNGDFSGSTASCVLVSALEIICLFLIDHVNNLKRTDEFLLQ